MLIKITSWFYLTQQDKCTAWPGNWDLSFEDVFADIDHGSPLLSAHGYTIV